MVIINLVCFLLRYSNSKTRLLDQLPYQDFMRPIAEPPGGLEC